MLCPFAARGPLPATFVYADSFSSGHAGRPEWYAAIGRAYMAKPERAVGHAFRARSGPDSGNVHRLPARSDHVHAAGHRSVRTGKLHRECDRLAAMPERSAATGPIHMSGRHVASADIAFKFGFLVHRRMAMCYNADRSAGRHAELLAECSSGG